MTTTRLVTLEEYARMPERAGMVDDLIDGEIIYRPIHSAIHGFVCGNVGFTFGEYRQRHVGSATMRCGLVLSRNPDTVIGPDASYWRVRESVIVEQGWPTIPPQAAYEVVDKDEPYSAVMRRVRLLLNFGIEILWLVDPFAEEVTEYYGSVVRRLSTSDTLDGGDVLPGFSCKVSDLFA